MLTLRKDTQRNNQYLLSEVYAPKSATVIQHGVVFNYMAY